MRTGSPLLGLVVFLWAHVAAAGLTISLYAPLPNNPQYFVGRLLVGTPAQQLSVVVDTRSSDVVLVSTALNANGGFDSNRSQSFAFRGSSSAPPVRFGEGSMFGGRLATDDFAVGRDEKSLVFFFADSCKMNGDDEENAAVTSALAPESSRDDHHCNFPSAFSGILGLGPGPTQGGEQRLVAQLGVQDTLGLWYSSKNQTGALTVGFINTTLYAKAAPSFIPFEKDGRALFEDLVVDYPANGTGTGFTLHSLPFLTDCGNPGVILNGLPNLDVDVAPDCSNFAYLPTITIAPVSAVRIVLSPNTYVQRSASNNCTSFLFASSRNHPFFAVGIPFLRQAFTVFDFSHNQIGFSYPTP